MDLKNSLQTLQNSLTIQMRQKSRLIPNFMNSMNGEVLQAWV